MYVYMCMYVSFSACIGRYYLSSIHIVFVVGAKCYI